MGAGGAFRSSRAHGNFRAVNFQRVTVGTSQSGTDIFAQVGAPVHHGQNNAVNFKLRLDTARDLIDGFEQ